MQLTGLNGLNGLKGLQLALMADLDVQPELLADLDVQPELLADLYASTHATGEPSSSSSGKLVQPKPAALPAERKTKVCDYLPDALLRGNVCQPPVCVSVNLMKMGSGNWSCKSFEAL